ncbi:MULTISPECIES: major capsid protein [unclassified Micromonospora]|uniref:major capsid protein n=1 Tax=unclassified Micromonospora TaxID=2617518 RepID=UPI00331B63E1
MALNFDLVDPAELTGFVRTLPGPATYTLNQFLNDDNIGDIDAEFDTLIETNRAARFRAWDSETDVGKRNRLERKRVSLPPLGQKLVVGEEARLRLEMARAGGDNSNGMIRAIYNDAVTNTNAVLARMELARGQVLTTGKMDLTQDGLAGIQADYGVDPSHFPVATTVWTDYVDSDPLEDMRTWADLYTLDSGEPPAYALTSRTAVGHMLRNNKVRGLAAANGVTPSMISRQQLNQLLESFDLPMLVEYNTLIDVDGTSTRPIPNDKMVFLPANPRSLGRTMWGITAEALELVGLDNPAITFEEAPGLVGVVTREGDPVRTWTKVTGVGMPVIEDPRKLLTAELF